MRNNVFLKKHKRLKGYQIASDLVKFFEKNNAPLTDWQKHKLYEKSDSGIYGDLDLPFQCYAWDNTIDTNGDKGLYAFLWRLSIPFYFIVWLLLVISMPFHWLFTGSFYYGCESGVIYFMRRWCSKVF